MEEPPFEISVEELHAALDRGDQIRVIDCREQDEYDICHIDGATLVPLQTFPEQIQTALPDKGAAVVVYCHHGMRSARATQYLRSIGYSNARSMAGGIEDWAVSIDPEMARY